MMTGKRKKTALAISETLIILYLDSLIRVFHLQPSDQELSPGMSWCGKEEKLVWNVLHPAEYHSFVFWRRGDYCSWQSDGRVSRPTLCKNKRSGRSWGLTLSIARAHPSKGRPCRRVRQGCFLSFLSPYFFPPSLNCCSEVHRSASMCLSPPSHTHTHTQKLFLSRGVNLYPSGCLFIRHVWDNSHWIWLIEADWCWLSFDEADCIDC